MKPPTYEYKGKQYSLTSLAKVFNLHPSTLFHHLKHQTPQQLEANINNTKVLYKGTRFTWAEFAQLLDTNLSQLRRDIQNNTFYAKYNINPKHVTFPKLGNKGLAKLYPDLKQLCHKADMPYHIAYSRLVCGYTIEEALTVPIKPMQKQTVTINGKDYSLEDLVQLTGKKYNTVYVNFVKRQHDPITVLQRWKIKLPA